MDKEFVDFLSKQFSKIDQRFDQQDKKFEEKLEEKFGEAKRHFGVLAEALKDDIRLLAEGHGILQNQMENTRKEIAEFRRDHEKSNKDLLSAIKFSYSDLDHRLTSL